MFGKSFSLAIPLSSSASSGAKRMNLVGGAFVALAFAMPFIAIPAGLGTHFQAGERTTYNVVALFFLALISWGVTRNRSDVAKASARLITGVVLCVIGGTYLAKAANEEAIAKQVARDALAFRAKQSALFLALGQRFDKVDLNTVLTPEALTTRAGMSAARATIAEYRALLAERRLLVQSFVLEFDRFIAGIPAGNARDGALSTGGARKQETVRLYADIDESQTALVEAIASVLDWGFAQAGKLGVRNGELLFVSREQQAALQGLLARLAEVEAQNTKVLTAASATQAKSQATQLESVRKAEQLLQK